MIDISYGPIGPKQKIAWDFALSCFATLLKSQFGMGVLM